MWWQLYFWIYSVLTVIGLIFGYGSKKSWSFVNFFEVVTSILAILAIYQYIHKKRLFSTLVWKVVFWVILIGYGLEILYKFTPFDLFSNYLESKDISGGVELLFGTLISLPIFYALYRLSYSLKSEQTKKKKK